MPVSTPHLTVFGPHNNNVVNLNQPFPVSGQVTNEHVSDELVLIDSVTVRVDGGPVIDATLTPLVDKTQTKVNFAASAQVTGGQDPHRITVIATNDQGASATQTVSVVTAPVVPPSLYSVQHNYVGSLEDVTVHQQHQTVRVTYSMSRDFSIHHPGSLHRFLYAEYLFHPKADGAGPTERGQTSRPVIGRAALPLSFKVYSPDGVEFTAPQVTLDDINRFRNLRGASQGNWHCEVHGDSGPIDLAEQGWSVVMPGKATVKFWLVEPIPFEVTSPLVDGPVTKVGVQAFAFDLFRVGQFVANLQSKSGVTPWEGTLRLKAPDGTVAASSHNHRLDFPVTLRTLNQSRDAAGHVRPWSLEVDTATPLGVGSAVRATVIGTVRIPVVILQDRINYLIGFNGSKLAVYGENKVVIKDDGSKERRALGRLKVLDIFSAETMTMRHLLDPVIKNKDQDLGFDKAQDPGFDKDNIVIEPNVPYNFLNKPEDIGLDLRVNESSLKVDAINIRAGASQHIQPPVPAVSVEVEVEGEMDVNLDGFNLGSVSLNNNRIALEVGAKLDSSGAIATVSWMTDDPINIDINWEAAVLANVLTLGLLNLGRQGLLEYLAEHVANDMIIDTFRSTVESAIGQAPRIMWDLLGANFTLTSVRMYNDDIVIDYVAPVEPDPRPNPFYTGVIGRAVTRAGPGQWKLSPPSLGDTWAAHNLTSKIDHIFVVMMENRAFDHVLGYRAALPNARGEDGLSAELRDFLQAQHFTVRPLSASDLPENLAHLKTRFPVGVGHAFADVAQQLSQKLQMPGGRSINSPQGFVDDFASRGSGGLDAQDVLGYYTDSDLALYAFLAEHYTYCERYFSAHPGPTLPNRMFSLGGNVQYDRTGEAILDNNNADNFALSRAPNIFDLLTRKNISWRVYETFPSITMLRFFARYAADKTNILGIGLGQLERDIAVGDVKSVTFIDPAMHSAPENDDHPPFADMLAGQGFIKRIYDALRLHDELWLKTLLIITYDEHGGFYDHVIPPVADALSMPGATGQFKADMTIPYGLRVPAFVVSPWVPAGKGRDVTLDHCSILKTILARFCGAEKPFLSDRVHASRTFESFLTETKPRLNVPPSPPVPIAFAPTRPPGERAIVTEPVSGKAFARGEVEAHDLMGMLARMLGR
jgi:phospholipase C